jgi:hypothetical protein
MLIAAAVLIKQWLKPAPMQNQPAHIKEEQRE